MAILYWLYLAICAHLAMASLVYAFQALFFLRKRFGAKRQSPASERVVGEGSLLPISLITVLDEDEEIAHQYLESLMGIDYPSYEVIAVCDGSSEMAVQKLVEIYGLVPMSFPVRIRLKCSKINAVYMNPEYPGFTLVHKARGGHSDSINCGINISRYSLIAQTDARFLLDKSCLRKAAAAMASDSSVVSVFSANATVEYEGLKPSFFECVTMSEYLKEVAISELPGGSFRSRIHFSCGFAVTEKETAIKAGGLRKDSAFPHFSQAMAINAYLKEIQSQKRIIMLTEPVCSFFAEYDFHSAKAIALMRSEDLAKSLKAWKKAILSPAYKGFGAVSLPYYAFFEAGTLIAETLGLFVAPIAYLTGNLAASSLIAYFLPTCIMGASLSLLSCACLSASFTEEKTFPRQLKLAIAGIVSNFGYRQLMGFYSIRGLAFGAISLRSRAVGQSSAHIPPS